MRSSAHLVRRCLLTWPAVPGPPWNPRSAPRRSSGDGAGKSFVEVWPSRSGSLPAQGSAQTRSPARRRRRPLAGVPVLTASRRRPKLMGRVHRQAVVERVRWHAVCRCHHWSAARLLVAAQQKLLCLASSAMGHSAVVTTPSRLVLAGLMAPSERSAAFDGAVDVASGPARCSGDAAAGRHQCAGARLGAG